MKLKTLAKDLFLYTLIDIYEDTSYGRTMVGQTCADAVGCGTDYFDLNYASNPEDQIPTIKNCDDRAIKEWWVVGENRIAVVLRMNAR